jgi:uncharacterized protein YjiS (DUF1127 family)
MATLAHSSHSASIARPAQDRPSLLRRFLAWRAERAAVRQTLRDLHRMEHRDLQDLGITQYDFDAIAHGVFRR